MSQMIISQRQRDALNYIESVKAKRIEVAKSAREARATMFQNGRGYKAFFISEKVIKLLNPPPKITAQWIDKEIAESASFIENSVCPDYTQDDGYSCCGLEDAWYEHQYQTKEWLELMKAMKKLI